MNIDQLVKDLRPKTLHFIREWHWWLSAFAFMAVLSRVFLAVSGSEFNGENELMYFGAWVLLSFGALGVASQLTRSKTTRPSAILFLIWFIVTTALVFLQNEQFARISWQQALLRITFGASVAYYLVLYNLNIVRDLPLGLIVRTYTRTALFVYTSIILQTLFLGVAMSWFTLGVVTVVMPLVLAVVAHRASKKFVADIFANEILDTSSLFPALQMKRQRAYIGGRLPFELKSDALSKTWLIFYRYAGCPMCQAHLKELLPHAAELKQMGVKIVAFF